MIFIFCPQCCALTRLERRRSLGGARMKNIQKTFPMRLLLATIAFLVLTTLTSLRAQTDSNPAEETSEPATVEATDDSLRTSLQLQEQLHAATLALQKNREEQAALEQEVAARLKNFEEVLTTQLTAQRSEELEAVKNRLETLRKDLDSNNRLLLYVGGGIAIIGFFVLLATGYLQWRSVTRLAEFSALVQSVRASLPAPGVTTDGEGKLLGSGTAVGNGKLLGTLTSLEKRIAELEHVAQPLPEPKAPTTATGTSGNEDADLLAAAPETTGDLLAQGQALLEKEKPAEALRYFDELLAREPNHGEALVKKGMALNALNQTQEALRCFDRAIAANSELTIAYLQKGGVLNRLERYEEALQCYELALRAQEKSHPS